MITAVYIIAVTFAVLALGHRLRQKNAQLRSLTAQRDSYAALAAPATAALTAGAESDRSTRSDRR